MVIQKTTVYKVLAIILVLVLLIGSSERVEAADALLSGTFEYNGQVYTYVYTDYYTKTLSTGYQFKYYLSSPAYILIARNGNNGTITHVSFESFNKCDNPDGLFPIYSNGNGNIYQICETGTGYNSQSFSIPVNNCTDQSGVQNAFIEYVKSDSFDDLLFSPNWAASGSDPLFMIQNMQADIVDGNIVVTWEPIPYMPFRMMENMYIRFGYANRHIGTETTTVGRNRYQDYEGYAKISDCGITIPISDLNIVENGYISSILATPYYYIADNLDNDTVKGKNTVIYFDDQGVSSTPIIVEPEVEDEIPIENTEQNIFYSIQNFFSGFFRNLINTLKSAVVPSGDDVLSLLQEMNDWFSVRFGFIWYPFDLAIDIMAAFALGEPDSKITVPALTINMFGGVTLWDEFQADLDPIDFLKYVRFFTSVIMCCGTVSLAIRKWDEWIGGRNS